MMGIIHSLFCSLTFCLERVVTWTCCAFLLVVLMFTVVLLMVYSISVGYHYAQKELASVALMGRRPPVQRRAAEAPLLAATRSEPLRPLEVYEAEKEALPKYVEAIGASSVALETERPTPPPDEQEPARNLTRRLTRALNVTAALRPLLRPLNWTSST